MRHRSAAVDTLQGAPPVFRILRHDLEFRSGIPWLTREIGRIFQRCPTGHTPQDAVTLLQKAGQAHLKIPGRASEKFESVSKMMEALKYRLFFENIWSRGPRPLLLHAGIVERSGGAAAICGGRGSGKTTLVLAAVSQGLSYLSEEIGVFDPTDLRFVCNPFPIALRDQPAELAALLSPVDMRLHESIGEERMRLWTAPIHHGMSEATGSPRAFVFVNRDETSRLRVRELSPGKGVDALMRHTYTRGNSLEHQHNIRAFVALAREARFCSLTGGGRAETVDAFLDLGQRWLGS